MALVAFATTLFPETITIQPVAHSSGIRGGDSATPGSAVSIRARVVEIENPNRVNGEGAVFGSHLYEVSTATDPSISVDDRINWGSRTLVAVASSVNVGGESRRWSTYCQEIT